MDGVQIDGNNILTAFDTIKGVREYCIQNQKQYLIECMTFRMRGHEEASGTKYVPEEMFEEWQQKDPVKNYECFLIEQDILSELNITDIRNEFKEYIESEIKIAFEASPVIPDTEEELQDIYFTASTPLYLPSA